jgi:hypothetical protein
MTTEVLKKKTGRYLCGLSVPSEARQIQTWLSCTAEKKVNHSTKEKEMIENQIVGEIKAYITWSSIEPQPDTWWKKFTAFF